MWSKPWLSKLLTRVLQQERLSLIWLAMIPYTAASDLCLRGKKWTVWAHFIIKWGQISLSFLIPYASACAGKHSTSSAAHTSDWTQHWTASSPSHPEPAQNFAAKRTGMLAQAAGYSLRPSTGPAKREATLQPQNTMSLFRSKESFCCFTMDWCAGVMPKCGSSYCALVAHL